MTKGIETVTIKATTIDGKNMETEADFDASPDFMLQFIGETLPKLIIDMIDNVANQFNEDKQLMIHDGEIIKVIQELRKGMIKPPKNTIDINIIGVKQFVDFVEFV